MDTEAAREAMIAANVARVEERIAAACARAGRARNAVTLVAVSKTRSAAEVAAAWRCGLRHFGENRVEEAEVKLPEVTAALPGERPTWHLIGHLQSRKARTAAELFDTVHSVDSLRLAARLDRFAGEAGRRLPVLLEVNVSGEASKFGWDAQSAAGRAAFVAEAQALAALTHLEVRGLMTMAPLVVSAEETRPVFRALRALRDELRLAAPFGAWDELSMGMTNDYAVAIEEGATLVRIGRAIFEGA